MDRSITENVEVVDAYYQPNANFLGSHGAPEKAQDDTKTKVNNKIKVTFVEGNGKKQKVTHSNINKATFDEVLKSINEFLNKK